MAEVIKQYNPITAYGEPIRFAVSTDGGSYMVVNDGGGDYYLAQTEVTEELGIDGSVLDREPEGTFWLRGKLVTRDLFGDLRQNDIVPHHVQIIGTEQYDASAIVPLAGTRLKFSIGDHDVSVYFASDLASSAIVQLVTNELISIDPSLRDAFQYDTTSKRFLVTTQTPKENPVSAFGARMQIENGTANEAFGFVNYDFALGDIPPEYDEIVFYALLQDKTEYTSDGGMSDYVPVKEENRLLDKMIPRHDRDIIKANKQLLLYWDGIAYGMDVMERETTRILYSFSVDKIDAEYLEEIARTLGFDLPILGNPSDDVKRDYVRNLIRIYQIKGTPTSVETIFRFLQYTTTLTERTSDASKNYPLIIITVDQADIESYYSKFLQTNDPNDFFDSFNFFMIDQADDDHRISVKQWNRLPIISGLDIEIQDSTGAAITLPKVEGSLLSPFDVSEDTGRLVLSTAPTPNFQVDEELYASGVHIGRVEQVIDASNYYVRYAENAVNNLPFSHITGTFGGGTTVSGVISKHLPNSRLKLFIDQRYPLEVDFTDHEAVFITGGIRAATAEEVDQAIQIAAAEQGVPIQIFHAGGFITAQSLLYGSNARVEVTNGNYAIGFTDGYVTPSILNPCFVQFDKGVVNISLGEGETIEATLNAEPIIALDNSIEFFFAHLIDEDDPYSVMVLTNNESEGKARLAQLAKLRWEGSGFRIDAKDAQDDYRRPLWDELSDSQQRQLKIFVQYRDNQERYWIAAGRPSAGDPTNPGRYNERHPWIPADLTVDPGLGNSIFAQLEFEPFEETDLTAEDLKRLLWFVEFLRPVHVVFDLIIQAISEEERVIGLPYDPLRFGFNTKFPDFLGNHPIFHWLTATLGALLEDTLRLPWLGYKNYTHRFWPVGGVGANYQVGDVIELYFIKQRLNKMPHLPFVYGDLLNAVGGAQGYMGTDLNDRWYMLYDVDETGGDWSGNVSAATTIPGREAQFEQLNAVQVLLTVTVASPGAPGVGYIDVQCADNIWAIPRQGTLYNLRTNLPEQFTATNLEVRHERAGYYFTGFPPVSRYVDREGNPLASPPWGMPTFDARVNVPHRLTQLSYPHLWDRGAGFVDFIDGENPAVHAYTLRDFMREPPIYDISEGALKLIMSRSDGGNPLSGVTIQSWAPGARIEILQADLTLYKQRVRTDTVNHAEDHWPITVVTIKDMNGNQFWAYARWQNAAYSTTIPEDRDKLYVWKDMRGTQSGWNPWPGSGVPTPLSGSVQEYKFWHLNPWATPGADRLQAEFEATWEDDARTPAQDVYHDKMDGVFSGMGNGKSESQGPLNIPLGGGFWANRTFGWNSTLGGIWPVFDADSMIVVEDIENVTIFSDLYNYDPVTGIVTFANPALGVKAGDFFVSNPLAAPFDLMYHTVLGVLGNTILIRPNTLVDVGGVAVLPNGHLNITHVTLAGAGDVRDGQLLIGSAGLIDTLLTWDMLMNALAPGMTQYLDLSPNDILALTLIPLIYYIQGDTELQNGYTPSPTPSVFDNFPYGVFYQGCP